MRYRIATLLLVVALACCYAPVLARGQDYNVIMLGSPQTYSSTYYTPVTRSVSRPTVFGGTVTRTYSYPAYTTSYYTYQPSVVVPSYSSYQSYPSYSYPSYQSYYSTYPSYSTGYGGYGGYCVGGNCY